MIHGLTIPGAMEVALRARVKTTVCLSGCARLPGQPGVFRVFIAITFGFLGGITGVMMGTEQLKYDHSQHDLCAWHFHATVVVGTSLTFMALTYFLIPVLFRRELILPDWPSCSRICLACRCTSSA